MRIKLVIKRFPAGQVVGGAEAFAGRLARYLVLGGTEVDVLSARYRAHWAPAGRLGVDGEAAGCGGRWIAVRRLPHPPVRLVGTAIYNLSLAFTLLRERRSYDCVFTTMASPETAAVSLASVLTGKPVVCKLASSGGDGDLGRIRRSWYGPLVVPLLRRVDRFVSVNGQVRGDLEAIGIPDQRVADIPNGIDTNYFRPPTRAQRADARASLGVDDGHRLILGVGRLKKEKSWATLIRSLDWLRRAVGDWQVVLLGEGRDRDALMALATSRGLQNRVVITSERSDVRRYLRAADLFVLPSVREGLSNALLEAMAVGLACVVSDVPGNAELIEDGVNGRLFRPRDAEALGSTIASLLVDDRIRQELGTEARATTESRFRIELVAKLYTDLFRSLGGAAREGYSCS